MSIYIGLDAHSSSYTLVAVIDLPECQGTRRRDSPSASQSQKGALGALQSCGLTKVAVAGVEAASEHELKLPLVSEVVAKRVVLDDEDELFRRDGSPIPGMVCLLGRGQAWRVSWKPGTPSIPTALPHMPM